MNHLENRSKGQGRLMMRRDEDDIDLGEASKGVEPMA